VDFRFIGADKREALYNEVWLIKIVAESQIFSQRDIISAPAYYSPSEVVNLIKLQKNARH
jgi:hypothetical protein